MTTLKNLLKDIMIGIIAGLINIPVTIIEFIYDSTNRWVLLGNLSIFAIFCSFVAILVQFITGSTFLFSFVLSYFIITISTSVIRQMGFKSTLLYTKVMKYRDDEIYGKELVEKLSNDMVEIFGFEKLSDEVIDMIVKFSSEEESDEEDLDDEYIEDECPGCELCVPEVKDKDQQKVVDVDKHKLN